MAILKEDSKINKSTGLEVIATVTDVETRQPKETGKGLSQENYTTAEKGIVDGVTGALSNKADLVNGLVPAHQLPSYVDDVMEFANLAAFPSTGEVDKIYVAINTGFIYRWTGTAYARLNEGVVLGETSTTAYRGDRGKTAYDHSIAAHAPANAQKNSDITKAEIEAKLTGAITTHTHPAAQITESATKRFVTDAEKAGWNGKATIGTAAGQVRNNTDLDERYLQRGESGGGYKGYRNIVGIYTVQGGDAGGIFFVYDMLTLNIYKPSSIEFPLFDFITFIVTPGATLALSPTNSASVYDFEDGGGGHVISLSKGTYKIVAVDASSWQLMQGG